MMSILKIKFVQVLILFTAQLSFSQNAVLENDNWKLSVNADGTIEDLQFKKSNKLVKFSKDQFPGPSWYVETRNEVIDLTSKKMSDSKYSAKYEGIDLLINYKDDKGKLLILTRITNNGHRITSVNLDLINALPLPERHPQDLFQIMPGESKTFRIYLDDAESLADINKTVAEITEAPAIEIATTVCAKGGTMNFSIISADEVSLKVYFPNGESRVLEHEHNSYLKYNYSFENTDMEGLYYVRAFSKNGKQSEAAFFVRKPYSWYMQRAMQAVLDHPQKASISHCESWYGFYATYPGGKYFPENNTIARADEQFRQVFAKVIDTVNYEPVAYKHRIQNISAMIGILVDRYQLLF